MAILAFCFIDCGSTIRGVPPQHVVFTDTHGNLVDPTGALRCNELKKAHADATTVLQEVSQNRWEPCFGKSTLLYRREVRSVPEYYEDMFDEMREFFQARRTSADSPTTEPDQTVRRLVILIHGGLATNKGNLEAARDLAPKMRADGVYPIFIVWQSNLWGSLVDSYFKVVNGVNRGWGPWSLLMPFKLTSDVITGVTKLPPNIASHFRRDIGDRSRTPFTHDLSEADSEYQALRWRYDQCPKGQACNEIAVSRGPWCWETHEGTSSTVRNIMLTPVKIATLPLIEGSGTSAWDAMIRHVKISFRNEDGHITESSVDGWPENASAEDETILIDSRSRKQPSGAGAVSLFFRRLRQELQKGERGVEWDVTLIGHSMGAIMVNEVLRQFGDLNFNNVVYMAAAASIEDYETSVLPYLIRQKDGKRSASNVWHLTLHPFAELREEYAAGAAPSGSLLVWIDEYLSDPRHFRERTVGRYENLMLALPYTPEEVRSQIHVRTFGVGERIRCAHPQRHGGFLGVREECDGVEFQAYPFWEEGYWKPREPSSRIPDCDY
ncbi:MAG TPA: hypothetical protein VMM77_00465 [Gemmatimonadaceae bacterium]|nr:hypothetical protein [Gemmatimonadaceae bacterium]